MASIEHTAKAMGLALLLGVITVCLVASVIAAVDVYLLAILAILCAILFTKLSAQLGKWTSLPYTANLAITVTTLMALCMILVVFLGQRMEHQVRASSDELDRSILRLDSWLRQHPPVDSMVRRVPFLDELLDSEGQASPAGDNPSGKAKRNQEKSPSSQESTEQSSDTAGGNSTNDSGDNGNSSHLLNAGWGNSKMVNAVSGRILSVLGRIFSTTFGLAMNVAFVLFVGVFLAIKPQFYRDHFALLFPISNRERVAEILDEIGETLFHWVQGRAATMLITGLGTWLVLWALGVPLAFTLGVTTGLLTFIPNVGGVMALLVSMLVAFSQGPTTVMWVVIAYLVLQFVESNLITPLIQQRQSSVPPPLLLTAQLMMGVLTGFLGVIVATPLVAAAIVLVREAYVVDVLESQCS